MMTMRAVWLIAAAPVLAFGQTEAASNFNPLSATKGGVHLYGVTVYSGYYSSGAPLGFEMPSQSLFLGPTAMVGAAATIGGSKAGETSTLTWTYSPSYFRTVYSRDNYTNGSLNHRAGVSWSGKLTSRWTLNAGGSGYLTNLQQLYFNPSALSSIAALPTSFDDLAAGVLTGKVTDPQLASLLTGAAQQISPEQAYLFGERLLSLGANVGLTWASSGRSAVSFKLAGSRSQPMNIGRSSEAPPPALLSATNVVASISWSHSHSPRTQISVEATVTRPYSRYQEGYTSSASFSIGRTLSRRWFARAKGGAGTLTYTRLVFRMPGTLQYLFGGSLGFKTEAHTIMVDYSRSIGDVYGLGSTSTDGGVAAWNWRRPGSNWAISASAGFQGLNNMTFRNARSWRTGAAVARTLAPSLFLSVQYMYLVHPLALTPGGRRNSSNGVSVSLTWSPSIYQ